MTDYRVTRSGRRPSQHPDELGPFIAWLQAEGVRSYLEIGARHGDTFHAIMQALPPGSRGLAVDLPGGAWGVESSRDYLTEACAALRRAGYVADPLFASSRAADTIGLVRARGPFDAILIDADHRYEAVRDDWLAYGPLSPRVAFHDIVGDGQQDKAGRPVEVPRLWAELEASHPTRRFVAPDSRMGIGVVVRPLAVPGGSP